jgi:mono/diheme cytochrome c family protein
MTIAAIAMLSAIGPALAQQAAGAGQAATTTYDRFAPLAKAGDPDVQHFIGFMHFFGEGTDLDYDESHYWFHLAAEEGDWKSMRNLGIMHARAIDRIPEKFYDPREANLWFSLADANSRDPRRSSLASEQYDKFLATDAEKLLSKTAEEDVGETVYNAYCAGCHGFDGEPPYLGPPEFAAGKGLKKKDYILLKNVTRGRGSRPHRNNDIPEEALEATLAYIRQHLAGKPGKAPEQQTASLRPVKFEEDRGKLGEKTYVKFCGGCHGFNGIAWYVNSPSFALRERMDKSDEALVASIKNGRGEMPSWEYMLQPAQIDALVSFIRTLPTAYEGGIGGGVRAEPGEYFRFHPRGEVRPELTGKNPTAD